MNKYIENRVKEVANFILDTHSTIRQTAKVFGVSKSTIHRDSTQLLPKLNLQLAREVLEIIEYNKSIRNIRGGEATRRKYSSIIKM